ncbi:hypothetical protein BKA63DRAFT_148635 [Paraphoma chrysanthemicola]|nr:hypothetical protein BKA63DRAFT_148635 [Paraphoma chrysanthemicola]
MLLRLFANTFDAFCTVGAAIIVRHYITEIGLIGVKSVGEPSIVSEAVSLGFGALLYALGKWTVSKWLRARDGKQDSMYGLEHGRLHLHAPTPMWMNMGHWGNGKKQKTMAEACRDLLKAVLAEAGIADDSKAADVKDEHVQRTLIDLGFGCGDQTIYLMSDVPPRPQDRGWWDDREHCVKFDHYVGITKDPVQAKYATKGVDDLYAATKTPSGREVGVISLFCEDAADPSSWSPQVKKRIDDSLKGSPECWMLALDTAYHFSPSRWPVIRHAYTQFRASFMAFDLCLSPSITFKQKLALRGLTALMGAPWANFGTSDEYKQKLSAVGYSADNIKIVDISEHVFGPLAQHLAEQDSKLKMLGLGIGNFSVAKSLFAWWGRSGVVRGVVVVARK